MSRTKDVEVIDLENSEDEDEDDDANGLSMDAVPFQEKVEKWLMDCNGAHARSLVKDSERLFKEKTVVVKEVIDETESLHSVDTEQYIKSNRRKTTTKVTTTTIKKYYSVVKVDNNVYNNNAECCSTADRQALPAVPAMDVANEDEKYSCKVIRKSPRKPRNNLPSVPEESQSKANPRKRNHQNKKDRLNADDNGCAHEDLHHDVPANVPKNCNGKTKIVPKCTPYNTRLNDDVNNRIRLCAEVCKIKRKPKRAPVTKKQNQLSTKVCRVKLRPFDQRLHADPLSAETSPTAQTASLRNVVNNEHLSSGSEEDDILLTSYKPFSLCP